jgi:exonuclease VII small subunit
MHVHDDEKESKSSLERMETIIDYWMEHNREHLKEHQKWLAEAERLGLNEVVAELKGAVELFNRATGHLELAKKKLLEHKNRFKGKSS